MTKGGEEGEEEIERRECSGNVKICQRSCLSCDVEIRLRPMVSRFYFPKKEREREEPSFSLFKLKRADEVRGYE